MHAASMVVSVARCAELLTAAGDKIDRSALSRYCDTHELKLGKVGREVQVDFNAVKLHRAENYTREVMSGAALGAGASMPVAEAQASLDIAPAAKATPLARPSLSPTETVVQMAEHRGLKAVQLRTALREEAKEEGLLTVVSEVDAGVAEAIVEMRAAFAHANEDCAERLAAELALAPEKVRVLRAAFKRFAQIGQERFATRIGRALSAGNEPEGAGRDRLRALSAQALRLRAGEKASPGR